MVWNRWLRAALMLAVIGAVAAGTGAPARAAVSFSVTPGLVDLAGSPGSRGSQALQVLNKGDEPIVLRIAIEPSPGVDEERSAVDWLSIEADLVEIAAGDQVDVPVQIAIPSGIRSGGYYARVSLTSGGVDAQENSAAIAGQLAVGFLITVDGDGDITRSARIGRFAPVLEADGRIGFRAELVNDGNVHLITPSGNVLVTDLDGAVVGRLGFPETIPLLPGLTSEVTTQGSLPLTPGEVYRAEATFSYLDAPEPLTVAIEFTNEPSIAFDPPEACENLDRGPSLSLTLENPGTIGLLPVVRLAVTSETDGLLGSASLTAESILWPGDTQVLDIDFPDRLVSGDYRLMASIQFDPREEASEVESTFQVGGLTGDPIPLCEHG